MFAEGRIGSKVTRGGFDMSWKAIFVSLLVLCLGSYLAVLAGIVAKRRKK